ncbi:eukaryotic-type carbonate dehydratase (macronuclear) [Tetrahymena thermophila SB210]|uniref:Carbonic anhydrase n=1 Tax=Tetrahymena thermophila (strain SB210) TaxID=312017 RepID=I7M2W0_TETTS|nr:eukaryotic-type carbonate dehydratase [Tetrahymena thermophila SB210]EAS01404.2 eukaryotic-type carbonate dehydratase [Tetrahymena thermophila SB210]|eukprot:XP_001021650.2 eukaryotic-type carbonate dehydratase [Tetrahymena thermophila SB210]
MKIFNLILVHLIILNLCYSYTYDQHGSDWPATCTTGQRQSPINIETYLINDTPECYNVDFQYMGKFNAQTLQNGHTLQTSVGNSLPFFEIDFADAYGVKATYRAIQFHFHSLSEHTIDGEHFDLELHIVTQNVVKTPKKLAVFGIFMQETENEAEETQLFKKYEFAGENVNDLSPKFELDFTSMLNLVFSQQNKAYIYQGSLTTPTCDEIVNWHVFKNPVKISKKTLDKFKELWFNQSGEIKSGNYRTTVPLNGRTVKYIKFCSSSIISFSYIAIFLLLKIFF